MRRSRFQFFLQTGLAVVLAFQCLALTAKPQVKQAENPRVPEPVVQAFKQANVPMSAVSIMVTPLNNASLSTGPKSDKPAEVVISFMTEAGFISALA